MTDLNIKKTDLESSPRELVYILSNSPILILNLLNEQGFMSLLIALFLFRPSGIIIR